MFGAFKKQYEQNPAFFDRINQEEINLYFDDTISQMFRTASRINKGSSEKIREIFKSVGKSTIQKYIKK